MELTAGDCVRIRSMRSAAKDVDDYIASAPDCTRAILVKLRRIFQQASPKLEEAIKWGVPCYVYKGPVGGFSAYTKHVSWGLWKARLLNDPDGLIGAGILKGGKITKQIKFNFTFSFPRVTFGHPSVIVTHRHAG